MDTDAAKGDSQKHQELYAGIATYKSVPTYGHQLIEKNEPCRGPSI